MLARVLVPSILLGFVAPLRADDPNLRALAEAKAVERQNALMKGDAAKIVALTHPSIVKEGGGPEQSIRDLTAGLEALKAEGLTIKYSKTQQSSDPVQVGDTVYVVV